jgi:hypothetical protein
LLGVAGVVGARIAVVAGHGGTREASSRLTQVTEGAIVSIVASAGEVGKLATRFRITAVHGAWILIGALKGAAGAESLLAIIDDGAGVLVVATGSVQGDVAAALGSQARVLGAGVPIIAGGPVHVAVAVVVKSVTCFGLGLGRGAGS